jgi:hypothetical protein
VGLASARSGWGVSDGVVWIQEGQVERMKGGGGGTWEDANGYVDVYCASKMMPFCSRSTLGRIHPSPKRVTQRATRLKGQLPWRGGRSEERSIAMHGWWY